MKPIVSPYNSPAPYQPPSIDSKLMGLSGGVGSPTPSPLSQLTFATSTHSSSLVSFPPDVPVPTPPPASQSGAASHGNFKASNPNIAMLVGAVSGASLPAGAVATSVEGGATSAAYRPVQGATGIGGSMTVTSTASNIPKGAHDAAVSALDAAARIAASKYPLCCQVW